MKKLLCGILAVMLVFSVFSACAETEAPIDQTTTTTTTEASTTELANATEDLSQYVGYWFVSEDDMTFDDTNPTDYANIQMLHISEIVDNKYITFTSHFVKLDNPELYIDAEPVPSNLLSGVPVGTDGPNTFRASNYGNLSSDNKMHIVELKDGKVIVDGGKIVLGYKTNDSTAFDEVMEYELQAFKNRFEGYWYMYNVEKSDNGFRKAIDELVVKEFTGDYLKVDYTIGEYEGKDVSVKLERGESWYSFGAFELEDGKIATLHFDNSSGYGITLYIGSEVYARGLKNAEYVGRFSDKSDMSRYGNGYNYNLSDYKGYWYVEDVAEDWADNAGLGYHELYIKEVDRNMVTLGYQFAGVTADIVTVVVHNNIAVFSTAYMDYEDGVGIIRFDKGRIYLEVRAPGYSYSAGLNADFCHQRTYSLKREGWNF